LIREQMHSSLRALNLAQESFASFVGTCDFEEHYEKFYVGLIIRRFKYLKIEL